MLSLGLRPGPEEQRPPDSADIGQTLLAKNLVATE
jgi:hypothetical protein